MHTVKLARIPQIRLPHAGLNYSMDSLLYFHQYKGAFSSHAINIHVCIHARTSRGAFVRSIRSYHLLRGTLFHLPSVTQVATLTLGF